MNATPDTRDALLDHAVNLFAEKGFKGTTVRSIAAAAGANLGAVTYHFGSKRALYDAVIEHVTAPIRERLARDVTPDDPLDGIEAYLRATFAFFHERPQVPRLILQQLVMGGALPPAAQRTIQMNIERIAGLIEAGQRTGSIRPGPARLMAFSVVGQPVFLAIYRRAFQESDILDQDDAILRRDLVDCVVAFVRAGLQVSGPRRASP